MRRCLAIIICGLMGILSPEQAVGAEKELKKMNAAIISADANEDQEALKTACKNCKQENCSKSDTLKKGCVEHCKCDEACGTCAILAPAKPPRGKKARAENKGATKPSPLQKQPQSRNLLQGVTEKGKKPPIDKTKMNKAAKDIIAAAGKQEELEKACKENCIFDHCLVSPKFGKFCQKKCSFNPCEEGPAIQKLKKASEKEKPGVCAQECKGALCGDDPKLAKACQETCGPKYARTCHVMSISNDLIQKITPEYQKAAQDILNAPDGKSKTKACHSKCARTPSLRLKRIVNPCAEDPAFGKFCVANCKRETIINCSLQLDQEHINATGMHEADPILGVPKEYRTNAIAIEKEKKAVSDLDKASPALIKACRACTKKACTSPNDPDGNFRKLCVRKCPLYTTVECGLSQDMMKPDIETRTKLFSYYEKAGEARKRAAENQASTAKSKGSLPNYYSELANEMNNTCTPNACRKSAKLKALCSETFVRVQSGGLFVSKGVLRKLTPLQNVCQ